MSDPLSQKWGNHLVADAQQRWNDKQAAKEARLNEAAKNCRGVATKQHPWGQFVCVGVSNRKADWRANLFFKTKAAAEYHAKHVAGFTVYGIAKVEGL